MTSPVLGSLIDTVCEKTMEARNTIKNMDFMTFTEIRWKTKITIISPKKPEGVF